MKIYDTKKIEALADRDQLISNKNAYDKQVPILEKEASKIGKEIAKLNTPEFQKFLQKLKKKVDIIQLLKSKRSMVLIKTKSIIHQIAFMLSS